METNKCTCERPDDNTCEYCEQQSSIQILKEPTMITDWLNEHGDPEITKKVEKEAELREASENYVKSRFGLVRYPDIEQSFTDGAKWQSERMYSEEDMSEAHFQGWTTRERFDDLSPDIIYPKGLDYEEKREYAFNLWFNKFKKK